MSNIVIVDGFEIVGKTSYIKCAYPTYQYYHPTHSLTDKTIGRHNSWAIGYGLMDMVCQFNNDCDFKLVIDRGVASSYVYPFLYNQESTLPTEVLKWYRDNLLLKKRVNFVYLCHKTKDSAKFIYEDALSHRMTDTNSLSQKYDTFENFEDYWKTYLRADEMFRSVYNYMEIEPEIVYTQRGFWISSEGFVSKGDN